MSWVMFAILASVCWAITNIIDKFVLTKWVKSVFVPLIFLGFISILASVTVYFFKGFSSISTLGIILALSAGGLYFLMGYFYCKAVQIEEISRLVPLFYLAPLFILVLAAILLGESLSLLNYIGVLILILGAIIISIDKKFSISISKASMFMVLAVIAISFEQIITKLLLDSVDYWTVFAYIRIGVFLFTIPFFFTHFGHLKKLKKKFGIKSFIVMSSNEIINITGILFATIAASTGFITLVNALSSVQPFFVLLFIVLLSIYSPKLLKEEMGKKTLFWKILAIVVMFIGALLVS